MSVHANAPAAVIVLAAGAGTRMKSAKPKILHEIGGRSMVGHALAAAEGLEPETLVAVVRFERERVVEHLLQIKPDVVIADQDEIPAPAAPCSWASRSWTRPLEGTVVVTYGDVPLLTTELLSELVAAHDREGNAVTVLTALLEDATGYGRILRAEDGTVTGIREHKDATDEERAIREVNSGIYAFDAAGPALRTGGGHHRQRAGRDVPHRCAGHCPVRRRSRCGRRHRGRLAGRRRQRPRPAGRARQGNEPPHPGKAGCAPGSASSTPTPPGSTSRSHCPTT